MKQLNKYLMAATILGICPAFADKGSSDYVRLEIEAQKSLKQAYLACSAADAEILEALKECPELVNKIQQWSNECKQGLVIKGESGVSLEDFIQHAKAYHRINTESN